MPGRGIDQALPYPSSPELYESYVRDARHYAALAEQRSGAIETPMNFSHVWGDALAELDKFSPDVRLINLETSVTQNPQPWPDKVVNYRMHPDNGPFLQAADIDVCALANNHLLDWGREGLLETLKTLDGLGIHYAGAGEDDTGTQKPVCLPLGSGGRVLIWSIGFSDSGIPPEWQAQPRQPGVWWSDKVGPEVADELARRINAEKHFGDLAMVSVHWGSNWGYGVPGEHRDFGRRLIDAGADLIHGHSSHHPRGFELYRGRPILYGCGDFINDYEGIRGHEVFRPELTLMYFCRFGVPSGKLESFWMTPLRMERFSLHRAAEQETAWLQTLLNRERNAGSPEVQLDGEGRLVWV